MAGEASRQNGRKGGRPKGSQTAETLSKIAAREFVRQKVTDALEGLLEAQIANSKGLKYLVVRNAKTGKFERVTQTQMESLLEPGNEEALERVEVWEKDPSVQAFTDLLNRALDKPAEQKQEIELTGRLDLVARLQSTLARTPK